MVYLAPGAKKSSAVLGYDMFTDLERIRQILLDLGWRADSSDNDEHEEDETPDIEADSAPAHMVARKMTGLHMSFQSPVGAARGTRNRRKTHGITASTRKALRVYSPTATGGSSSTGKDGSQHHPAFNVAVEKLYNLDQPWSELQSLGWKYKSGPMAVGGNMAYFAPGAKKASAVLGYDMFTDLQMIRQIMLDLGWREDSSDDEDENEEEDASGEEEEDIEEDSAEGLNEVGKVVRPKRRRTTRRRRSNDDDGSEAEQDEDEEDEWHPAFQKAAEAIPDVAEQYPANVWRTLARDLGWTYKKALGLQDAEYICPSDPDADMSRSGIGYDRFHSLGVLVERICMKRVSIEECKQGNADQIKKIALGHIDAALSSMRNEYAQFDVSKMRPIELWKALDSLNWKHQYAGKNFLQYSQFYMCPGITQANGTLNVNMFPRLKDLFNVFVRRHKPIRTRAKPATGKKKYRRRTYSGRSGRRSSNNRGGELGLLGIGSSSVNNLSSFASPKRSLPPLPEDGAPRRSPIWKRVWVSLQNMGWTWSTGRGLHSYYYLMPGVTRASGKLGVDMFGDEASAMASLSDKEFNRHMQTPEAERRHREQREEMERMRRVREQERKEKIRLNLEKRQQELQERLNREKKAKREAELQLQAEIEKAERDAAEAEAEAQRLEEERLEEERLEEERLEEEERLAEEERNRIVLDAELPPLNLKNWDSDRLATYLSKNQLRIECSERGLSHLGTQKERIKRLLWWKQHQRGGELVSGKMEGWRRRVFQDELSKATLIELCFERDLNSQGTKDELVRRLVWWKKSMSNG